MLETAEGRMATGTGNGPGPTVSEPEGDGGAMVDQVGRR